MIESYYLSDKVTSTSPEAFSLYEKSRLGEKKKEKIEYATVEALYLLSEGKLKLKTGKKILSYDAFLRLINKKDKRIESKYAVFEDLRKRGYIVKTALKFGAEFRVYGKGIHPGEDHAKWIVYAVRESEQMSWQEFAAKNRVAHSTKKRLLLGIVDEEGDVSYYEVSWVRP